MIMSIFCDIWIDYTYIYTSDWSEFCSEEGPLFPTRHTDGACHFLDALLYCTVLYNTQ